jgi:hypothetical protein
VGNVDDTPKPPKGLGSAGRALWRRIIAGVPPELELDERELEALRLAARQSDDLAALEKVIAKEGVGSVGSAGQPVVHPAVVEARQSRLAVGKLLDTIRFADPDGALLTGAGRHAQGAANTRWGRSRARAKRREDTAAERSLHAA